MKRMICLAMCALTAVFACACGEEKTAAPTEAETEAATQIQQTEAATDPTGESGDLSLKAFIAAFDTAPAIEEAVVYEDEKLSVTVGGVDYTTISGPSLQLTIQNGYDKDIIVQAPYAVVNGFMVSPETDIEVPAGKSATGSLTLPYFNLAISGVTSLQKIEFALRIVEARSYDPIGKTELMTVATTAEQTEDIPFDESGQIAYDHNDIKIVLKGVDADRAYSDGAELTVYMYNGTDSSVVIQTDDVIVNGYDMTSAMSRTILPSRQAADVVTFYTLDMEEYGIEEIDSVNVSFEIKDAESWETIDATDLISVTLPEKETTAPTEEETK